MGFDQNLIRHAVTANRAGDSLHIFPKFINVDIAAPLQMLQRFVKGAELFLRLRAVAIEII